MNKQEREDKLQRLEQTIKLVFAIDKPSNSDITIGLRALKTYKLLTNHKEAKSSPIAGI